MNKIRIGTVGYLNARPLHKKLDRTRFEVIEDHPSVIAKMLAEGTVDVALVPVGAILTDGADLRIIPGFCVGAAGPVTSVLLVGETPIEAWTTVLLDGVSRTSALLAKILLRGPLAKELRPDIEIVDVPPTEGLARTSGSTASLVIGDAALHLPDRLKYRIDLADVWFRWSGVPFVFAVWAGRPNLSPALVAEVRRASAAGVAGVPGEYSGGELEYLTKHIRFALDDRALMGLRRFGALLVEEGYTEHASVQLFGPEIQWGGRDPAITGLLERAISGELLDFADSVRLAKGGRLADLAVAADLRRKAIGLDRGVQFGVGDAVPLLIGAGESIEDRVRTLITWRISPPSAMMVVAAEIAGPVGSTDNTAEDQLRWQAIARLLGPPVPLQAAPETEGLGMAQLGLRMGVDRWGPATEGADAKHQIREAGFIALEA